MSHVFVSCAYRDREVGGRLVALARSLGHEVADDLGDSSAPDWWADVVRGIEGSDLFVAVVSPAYDAAQSCRLAARLAEGAGVQELRLDADADASVLEERLAEVLGRAAPSEPEPVPLPEPERVPEPTATPEPRPRPRPTPPRPPPAPDPAPAVRSPRGPGWQVTAALVTVLAVVLLLAGLATAAVRSIGADDEPEGEEPPTSATESPQATDDPAGRSVLLAAVEAAERADPDFALPAKSCRGGSGDVLACRDPAPHVASVVLTYYPGPAELYEAYTATLGTLGGDQVPENTGDCSFRLSEGEVGWNLAERHTREFSIAEQTRENLDPLTESAGRLFCTTSQDVMRLVWTQDPHLLVTVRGQPADLVVDWWRDVHLELGPVGAPAGAL